MNPDKLFNYLDGKLSSAEREAVEDQLIRDPDLQRQFAMARKIHERMSGDVREVILDEAPGAARGRHIIRRVMIVFLALIFVNTLVGVVVIGILESKRRQTKAGMEQNRQDVTLALQKAAENALPKPSLDVDEIKIAVPAKQQDAMVEKISAAAKNAGGSAAKNLSNENGTLVFAEIPAGQLSQFRDALTKLGAILPASSSPSPASGNAILQIRIVERGGMIAITFALPAESSGIVGALHEREDENGIVYGKLSARDVAIFHTGVGRKACERNIETFLRSVRPEILISSGFAGSLTDQLNVGDLIIAEDSSDRSMATRLMEGGAPAPPGSQVQLGPGSQELTPPSRENIRMVKLATIDSMVDSVEERYRLAEQHAADAIDMETDVIARVCAGNGIPMLSLRVITDSPAQPFPVPPHILFDVSRQKTNFGKLIPYVLMHPSAAGGLIRFAQQISRARAILTEALVRAISQPTIR